MHRFSKYRFRALAGALAVSVSLSGCDDFITGPGLTDNPNDPIAASLDALFIAMQTRQFVLQQGQLARTSAIWTQQLAGIFNQQREWGNQYNFTENDIAGHYAGFYIGGGLLDLRKIQAEAAAAGNTRFEAIAKVWEAFSIGTAASLWGDIVYREAVDPTIAAPMLDPQEQVYADVQALLDDAISQLTGAPTTALSTDLVYNGNSDRWRRAAWTLKARFFLHTAPRHGSADYTAALAAANQGINEAPTSTTQAWHGQAPGDLRSFHGNTLDDGNIWSQFDEARTDLAANNRFVQVLQARSDPRLAQYFSPASDGMFRGANQFGNTADGSTAWSTLNRTARVPRPFRQPFVTWVENQLIIAEAQFQLANPGAALVAVNNVRAALGLGALPGPITLEQIMVEKWIAQFQNIDVYSDYRRTCFPVLVPGGPSSPTPAASVPFRFPYGSGERLQNPNIPPPSQQPAKNWNHANITCPTSGGTI